MWSPWQTTRDGYPRVWQRVGEEVKAGRQVFVVAPAITAAVVEEDTDIEDEGEEQGKRPLSTVEETLPLCAGLPSFRR